MTEIKKDLYRQIFGLRVAIRQSNVGDDGRLWEKSIGLSKDGSFVKVSALELAALFGLAEDLEVREELIKRIEEEKRQMQEVHI